jgi:hypothetical protein
VNIKLEAVHSTVLYTLLQQVLASVAFSALCFPYGFKEKEEYFSPSHYSDETQEGVTIINFITCFMCEKRQTCTSLIKIIIF